MDRQLSDASDLRQLTFDMKIEILRQIPFALDAGRMQAEMHLEAGSPEADELRQLVEQAQRIGKPKAVVSEALVTDVTTDQVRIGREIFTSRLLTRKLAHVGRVFVLLTTCGQEMDAARVHKADLLQCYWWDMIKQQMLTAATEYVRKHVCQTRHLHKTTFLLPGSSDRSIWPIEQQQPLFRLLGTAPAAIGVTLSETCLMTPDKSLSGILFATDREFRGCEVCRRRSCFSRHAPFDQKIWDELEQF